MTTLRQAQQLYRTRASDIAYYRQYLKARIVANEHCCWIWKLKVYGNNGYGCATVKNKSIPAHRLAWTAFKSSIPEGLCVLHTCDEPRCCNPDHLFLGTHKQNMEDMVAKGRARPVYGSKNHLAKLSESEVMQIRKEFYTTEATLSDLSKKTGISKTNLADVIRGIRWKHVEGADENAYRAKTDALFGVRRRLTPLQRESIRADLKLKIPYTTLTIKHKVSLGTLTRIAHEQT